MTMASSAEMEKVVFRMVCQSYGVEKCYDPYIDNSTYLLRFLKYNKLEGARASAKPTAHTDKSFLSYLQQNNIRGLEVRNKDSEVHFRALGFNFHGHGRRCMCGKSLIRSCRFSLAPVCTSSV
ncbi:Fe2OG dioxygenase domain-containing protein [Psidium guajava]|nr:Fe2OG dioxygenase domain-containing protein [Psidium guajava]